MLVAVGYDPDASQDRVQVTMGGGVESVPRLVLTRLTALVSIGSDSPSFRTPSLPMPASMDARSGFLARHLLTLDFRVGLITLA